MEVTCQALPACSEQRSASCVSVAVTTNRKYSMQYWLINTTALAWQSCGNSGIGP